MECRDGKPRAMSFLCCRALIEALPTHRSGVRVSLSEVLVKHYTAYIDKRKHLICIISGIWEPKTEEGSDCRTLGVLIVS